MAISHSCRPPLPNAASRVGYTGSMISSPGSFCIASRLLLRNSRATFSDIVNSWRRPPRRSVRRAPRPATSLREWRSSQKPLSGFDWQIRAASCSNARSHLPSGRRNIHASTAGCCWLSAGRRSTSRAGISRPSRTKSFGLIRRITPRRKPVRAALRGGRLFTRRPTSAR